MFRKLIHHRPFFRKPPFEDPRELGERYPKEPILTDYWIKPYILEALKHYPRLNDSCVVEGLWTFANSILLKNYKAAKRVPPTFDDPEVTHKIAFLDKDDVELGAIKFWRKVDSTFGIDIKLGNAGISIVGDNDNPSVSLVNTPVNDGPKEIVNVEYLNQALVPLNDALNALADRVEALEDLYEDQIKPIVTDPNGNIRDVHTTIHADASDANLPTCGAVYQYGKGISDALNSRIDSLANALNSRIDGLANGLSNLNNALNGLSSSISSIANDVANLKNSGGSSNDSYIFAYPSGSPDGFDLTLASIKTWDIVTGDHIASAVEVSVYSTENHPDIITYTINQNSSLDSNLFTAAYYGNEAVYNPTNLSSSDSYRCIVAPEVVQGTAGYGNTRPTVRVKAGVFQKLSGDTLSGIILGGFVGSASNTPGIYKGIVGTEYDIEVLFQDMDGTGHHAFSTYPPGTKFECVVASSAVKDTGGDNVYRNVANGAFKLKSLG